MLWVYRWHLSHEWSMLCDIYTNGRFHCSPSPSMGFPAFVTSSSMRIYCPFWPHFLYHYSLSSFLWETVKAWDLYWIFLFMPTSVISFLFFSDSGFQRFPLWNIAYLFSDRVIDWPGKSLFYPSECLIFFLLVQQTSVIIWCHGVSFA